MDFAYHHRRPELAEHPYGIKVMAIDTPAIIFKIKHFMESSSIVKPELNDATLFQIAARIEDVPALPRISPAAPVPDGKKSGGVKAAAAKSKSPERKKAPAKKTATNAVTDASPRTAAAKKSAAAVEEQKITKFCFEAPAAGLVKLVADFTDWEKSPLDMIRTDNGIWATVVPLQPGRYAYRFIVDGQWCDDPYPVHSAPNPFGTTNSVIEIA
jgi:hypothetical protein